MTTRDNHDSTDQEGHVVWYYAYGDCDAGQREPTQANVGPCRPPLTHKLLPGKDNTTNATISLSIGMTTTSIRGDDDVAAAAPHHHRNHYY